jgi:hypothetical protein
MADASLRLHVQGNVRIVPSKDDLAPEIRRDPVDTARELREVTGRDARKKVMFNVKEHIECDPILDSVMKSSRKVVCPVAVVVDGPHREESSHALANQHGG